MSAVSNKLRRGKSAKFVQSTSFTAVFKSTTATSTISRGVELRCYKFSPRVEHPKVQDSIELYEYEANAWREAFNTMGRLQGLNLKEATPFTTLNKAPYHCSSLSREFNVAYGKMSQVEGASVKGSFKPKKEIKVSFCNCILSSNLMRLSERLPPGTISPHILYGCARKSEHYLPLSAVQVKFDNKSYDVETICEWLQRFGPFVFTIRKGDHTLIVVFESMKSAYTAVVTPLPFSRIVITWINPKFFNFGHYIAYKDYTVEGDATWQKLLAQLIIRERGIMKMNKPNSSAGKNLKFET
ncbi:uncharacterized protein LOC131955510 [Physella acuta]|uniref:uncharacterized protein LOC131955510 n=1 Tax=Physella acuta TaxID=109671 RepID=UPI0027DE8700|nr:uncharacterized protein LOC131955510 [Physella acuta]